jgi:predicted dehydrogenase
LTIKLSIAGLGWWGKVMIERLTISDKLEIVSLIDPFPDEESQKIAKNHNLEIYKDFDEALSLSKSDAIILCTPNSFHMEQTIKASKLGIHVFCEKPLSLKSIEVKKMIDACNENGLILGVGHERRFEKGWMRLKDIVTSNKLGSIMYAEGHFSHDKLAGLPSDNWRADPKFAPAAGMTGMGVHLTDLMIWLFGPVERVFATTAKRVLDFKTGDVVTASLQHHSGLSTQITAILKTTHYQRVTIWGENGWVELVDSSHPDTPGPSYMKTVMNDGTVEEENFEWTDTVSANIHNFIDSINGEREYLFTDVEKFQNISVLEAIYQSSLSKQNEKVKSFN